MLNLPTWLPWYLGGSWMVLFVGSFIYLTLCSDGTEPFESARDAVEGRNARLKRKIANKVIAPALAAATFSTLSILYLPWKICCVFRGLIGRTW